MRKKGRGYPRDVDGGVDVAGNSSGGGSSGVSMCMCIGGNICSHPTCVQSSHIHLMSNMSSP